MLARKLGVGGGSKTWRGFAKGGGGQACRCAGRPALLRRCGALALSLVVARLGSRFGGCPSTYSRPKPCGRTSFASSQVSSCYAMIASLGRGRASLSRRSWSSAVLVVVLLLLIAAPISTTLAASSFASQPMTFCKCVCFGNSTILPMYLPRDPERPCLSCTRSWCLDQKLQTCVGAKSGDEDLDTGKGDDGDVEARCFQRDSPKSHVLVVLFIIVTSALLLGALLKQNGFDLQLVLKRGGFRGLLLELNRVCWTVYNRAARAAPGLGAPGNGAYHSMPVPAS